MDAQDALARKITHALIRDGIVVHSAFTVSCRLIRALANGELAESDRRAGESERKLDRYIETERKFNSWLQDRKEEEGYHNNTSFDNVWANVRAERDKFRAALAPFAEALTQAEKMANYPDDCVDLLQHCRDGITLFEFAQARSVLEQIVQDPDATLA